MLLQGTFWVTLGLLFYTYLGYPLTLLLLTRRRQPTSYKYAKEAPSLTVVVAAYNEESVIGRRIENLLCSDYPHDKLRIIVVSDGSTDRTTTVATQYATVDSRVTVIEATRGGKASALNAALPLCHSDVIVFSDANTRFENDALRVLVEPFSDPEVGCVSGKLLYRNPNNLSSGENESAYWRYETALKRFESALGYAAGANGAIYAVRRELLEPFPPGTINDDFLASMRVVQKGFKVIFEERARAYEDVAPSAEAEFRRHVRDGAGHYLAIWQLRSLLDPRAGRRMFIYFSHRFLRWMAPFLLILLFIVNSSISDRWPYGALLLGQCAFYLLAILGSVGLITPSLPFLLRLPSYFCNLNLALLLGFFKLLLGQQKGVWERTARA